MDETELFGEVLDTSLSPLPESRKVYSDTASLRDHPDIRKKVM